ncbi:snRNA-activating protein complex subunit 4 isoform X2 [Artibeus jamaicensis]|nr:snRNA-activating protein complex subunit 4 isoform X2 [Artibeus jamaicensis]XP_053523781.1 snRNA-activating protein complex subunit 4 isoform X2 [Artibeus jamaicensis]XP_053523782.1 snRNA-activating protein complex subunit 4 isoform X2 [Artibeus jamaicensis]XP_053523783.1 snRNA-activating protein complex subunit 4 isoform X2 [Artibeus jamaicensis]
MDVDAEREKITQEIKELERILDPSSSSINVEVSESSLDSDSEADSLPGEDSDAASPPLSEEERWGGASNEEDDPKEKVLPEDPETCLQLNMVYQEVIQEKLAEVSLLLAQNREQQEEVMWDLAGSKGPKVKDGKSLPLNLYIGHFLKPYFKDKVTGVGPPANEDAREKAAQGIKTFSELLVTKWKSWEKALLRKSVVSDRLQRLLQPKFLKLEYLQQKQSRASSVAEKRVLETQIREAEKEIQDINQLQEAALLGSRLDSHDWEKISNVNFEGGRSAEEIRKFWQNWEHPSINKQEWTGQEVEQLKAVAARHGHLHWQKIAEELGTSRSAFQCLQKYQQHSKALRRREWTEEEDRMLTQLVQEMRVGSHIPYRRIVYYMEGRDSMQLTYRWTKSLDPSLRKGLWAPEEDAKLLQAVAKYGEQDWFKIREEVPGRSDAQCRDRYLRKLHFSLKKGRWNSKEEEKLIELIEKHGVGHWAKIASELPHRTGSQCLSKWKVMVRKRRRQGRRRRRRRLRSVRWSSTSEDSSSQDSGDSSSEDSGDSEDSKDIGNLEREEMPDVQEDGQAPPSALHTVPDMALWVPARQGGRGPRAAGAGGRPGRLAALPSPLKVPDVARGGARNTEQAGRAQALSGTHSTNGPGGTGHPRCADLAPASSKGSTDEGRQRVPKESLETVLQALRASTATRCRTPEERLKQPCLLGSPQGTAPGGSITARPRVQGLWRRRHRGHALQRRLLERRLLMAVSPWVGDVAPPCTPRRSSVSTRADSIQAQLQNARLASTPVFTLFIQLFQIDTTGCMEVVRERRAQLPTLPRVGAQAPSSAQDPPGRLPSSGPAREAAKKSAGHGGSGGLQTCRAESASQAPPSAPSGPRPKPKTVSELLREKRLREARASKAAQGPVVLPPQLLVSSPVVLQAHLPLASQGPPAPAVANSVLSEPGAPAAASLSPSGSRASASDKGLPVLQPTASAAVSLEDAKVTATSRAPHLGSSLAPVNGLGQSQAPATSRKQGLPEALPFLPAAPSPIQLPIQPLSLMPALGAHRGGPQVAASTPLPVTWVLTAQGLLSVPVPSLVGLPGPAGTSDPKGLPAPSLLLTETRAGQCPTDMDRESAPPSKTDLTTLLPPQISAEVDGDVARAPEGHSSSGEVGVAGDTAAQAAVLASPPGAEAPCASQLPLHGGAGLGGTLASPSEPGETGAPVGLERPPAAQPGPEKGGLQLGLLSQESEVAVREWLGGLRGVCVPPLRSRLPYQPPALCNLRALSHLLLHKQALEHRAASLGPGGVQASLGRVRRQLQGSPAYLLLKARFLAAFTLPALLATLSPPGVPTTLSAAARADSESEDQDPEELESIGSCGPLAGPAATAPVQGAPGPGEGSAPSHPDCCEDLDVLRTRHGQHVRKRRRLL